MISQYTPKDVYACDGVTYEFAVTFQVDRDRDVYVTKLTAAGVETPLVRNMDYVVRKNEDASFTVVTRVDATHDPLPAGVTLTVRRVMLFFQPSGNAQMSAITFQHRINSLTYMFQHLREQAERTLQISQPLPPYYATSKPYALLVKDSMNIGQAVPISGAQQSVIVDLLDVGMAIPTGGELRDLTVSYENWPLEELDVAMAVPTGGTLSLDGFVSYENWPLEELDVAMAVPTGGALAVQLIGYNNWPLEEFDVGMSVPTSGTLSTP